MIKKSSMADTSILVIPFANLSQDPDSEYFSDGITDEVIIALSTMNGIKVASRTSSFYLKDKNLPIVEIGKTFSVNHILEGTVRKYKNDVRIAVRLIEITDEKSILTEIYNRQIESVFQIQNEIASDIASKLKVTFKPDPVIVNSTHNSEAFDLYLKGKYHWHQFSNEQVKLAAKYFERAIKKDDQFALAYSGLADCYIIMGTMGYRNPQVIFPKAKEAAKKALSLNNKHTETHISMAYVRLFYDWDLEKAKSSLQQALRLNPENAGVHHTFNMYYMHCGNLEKAQKSAALAVQLDPMALTHIILKARAYYFAKNYHKADEICDISLELDPNFYPALGMKGWIQIQLGNLDKAIEYFKTYLLKNSKNPDGLVGLGYAYARAGFYNEATKCLEELANSPAEKVGESLDYYLAIIYVGLKDHDKVYDLFKKAIDDRLGMISGDFLNNPIYDDLKKEERFIKLLKQCNIPKNYFSTPRHQPRGQASVLEIQSNTAESLLLDPSDILYIKAQDNYSIIVWSDAGKVKEKMLRVTLNQLETQLNEFSFITRCHKSFIINLRENYALKGNSKGYTFQSSFTPEAIPVSRSKGKNIISQFKKLGQ